MLEADLLSLWAVNGLQPIHALIGLLMRGVTETAVAPQKIREGKLIVEERWIQSVKGPIKAAELGCSQASAAEQVIQAL